MPYTNAERDLQRAQEYRALANKAKSADAKRDFNDAADRLEKRAAKKARQVGRGRKRRGGSSGQGVMPYPRPNVG